MYIQTNDLVKTYKERNVVNKVSIHVDQGQIVGLLGPNGAGKTTTFYMIVGIEHPSDGSIFIDDHDITGLPIHKRAAYGIGYLPQEASIFRKLTVEENLLAMLETTSLSRKEQKKKAESLMEEFTITKLRDRLGIQLSGGERRRVEIARCLVMDPAFILLDEPFAGIDPLAVKCVNYLNPRKGTEFFRRDTIHNYVPACVNYLNPRKGTEFNTSMSRRHM